MWSPRITRRALLAALGAGLAGCGFVPAHGPRGDALALRGRVALADPVTPFDYRLRAALEDRLGRADAAAYDLSLTVTLSRAPAAVSTDGTQMRSTLSGSADLRLTERATLALLAAATVGAFTAHSTTGSTVATAAARQDAENRLALLMADQIVTRLLALPSP